MAGASLLTLLDDIAAVLDDVSLMTKVAAKKTTGVLGDDLALNAQQVTGVSADRELPVVWAVAKGSLRNKAILVPAALLTSAFAPWAVVPLLMLGGVYLCFEGFEKITHKFLAHDQDGHDTDKAAANVDLITLEKQKVNGDIRTDFILSAEIIAITLGTVTESSFTTQVFVLGSIALLMTLGVYGLVATIVKLDDIGLCLARHSSKPAKSIGGTILHTTPYLMKALSAVGTAAMFMVGGGILTHGIPVIHHAIEQAARDIADDVIVGPALTAIIPAILNTVFGILTGAVALAVTLLLKHVLPKKKAIK